MNINSTWPGQFTINPGVYESQPCPGSDFCGNCLGCGQSLGTGGPSGHMCMVPVSPLPRVRTFKVTIEEVEPYQGFQTTTHPGWESVWVNPTTFC